MTRLGGGIVRGARHIKTDLAGAFRVSISFVLLSTCSTALWAQEESRPEPSSGTIEKLEECSQEGFVTRVLREAIDRMDTPRFRWALKIIENTGVEVERQDFSWQMGLRVKGSSTWCGGTLISPQYVLTAAHCLDANPASASGSLQRIDMSQVEVFAASHRFGERPILVDQTWPYKVAEGYKAGGAPFASDAALVKLWHPLLDATPAPVGRRSFGTGPAVTSGWGDHPSGSTGTLRAVTVPVVDATLCRDHLSPQRWDQLGPQTICTVDDTADACARDSGGPLVVGTRQKPQTIGIVSWGGSGSCGRPGANDALLGGYTRTSLLADWIVRETGDSNTVVNTAPGKLMQVEAPSTAGDLLHDR